MRLIIICLAAFSTYGFATFDRLLPTDSKEVTYVSSGTWKNQQGERGRWSGHITFKKTSKENESLIVEIQNQMRLFKNDKEISNSSQISEWHFSVTGQPNHYAVFEGGQKIGVGSCSEKRGCTQMVRRGALEVSENLFLNEVKNELELNGIWRQGEFGGAWTGSAKTK